MSIIIAASAIQGAHKLAKEAREIYKKALKEKGGDCPVAFPNTGYYIPIIYSMTGVAVEKLSDFEQVFDEIESLLPDLVDKELWLPYLGPTLDAGMAALFSEEIIEACKYITGPNPVNGIWLGAADDVILRERGIQFVDGSAPGFAAIVGAAPDVKTAVFNGEGEARVYLSRYDGTYQWPSDIEVIGNIFENPELLEVKP